MLTMSTNIYIGDGLKGKYQMTNFINDWYDAVMLINLYFQSQTGPSSNTC